jgi:hypothetical protein
MVDLTITVVDENSEDLAQVTIYEDGSDAEAATRIIQWIVEQYEPDESEEDIFAPLEVVRRDPDPEKARPVYREATAEESRGFEAKAKEWDRSNNPANMFSDCISGSRAAIMEFLANQEGITLFPGGVGKPLDKRLIKQRLRGHK